VGLWTDETFFEKVEIPTRVRCWWNNYS